jgi:hypothetical protein
MAWLIDFWHWWTTARVAAAAAGVGGTMAVVTGSTAVRTLRHNREAMQRSTRPMMTATLRPSGSDTAALAVTNAGQSFARNVSVSFDPPLPIHDHTADGDRSVIPFVRHRYSKPVAVWTPGYTARNEFYVLSDERDEAGFRTNVDGISHDTVIVFDYTDDDGNRYSDRLPLDPTLIQGETWSVTRRNRNGEETILHDGSPWLADD